MRKSLLRKVRFAGLLAASLFAGIVTTANAAITINHTDSTSATFSSWGLAPNAGDTTGANSVNIASFNSNETNYGPQNSANPVPAGTLGSLGQSITASAGGTLTDIQILVTGNVNGVTFNLLLLDAGPAGSNGAGLADTSTNGYGNNALGIAQNPSATLVTTSGNLLSSASQGLAGPGYTLSGATAAVWDFHLTGADAITLNAGDEYVVEINSPSSNSLGWLRMADNTKDYVSGQAFRSRAPLNGNPARDMSLSLVVSNVPEPTSLVLLGIGAVGLTFRRRRPE
jgi:hypothetical protein